MKRTILLFLVISFLSSELFAQQSSRRTRQIPRPTNEATSATDELRQQVDRLQRGATDLESPFNQYEVESESRTDPGNVRQPLMPSGVRVAERREFPPQIRITPPPPLSPRQPRQQHVEPVTRSANVVSSNKSISTRIEASPEINVGQTASLKLIATNEGHTDLSGVNLIIRLPEHVEFATSDPPPVDRVESMIAWRLDTMAARQDVEINLQVIPLSKQPMKIITEFAIIDRNQIDIDVRQPDVKMVVSTIETAIVGQIIQHVVKVWNEGDGIAHDLKINVDLAPGMELADSMNDNLFNIGMLKPGEVRELTLETESGNSGVSPLTYHVAGDGIDLLQAGEVMVIWPELYAEILGPRVNLPNRDGSYTININNPGEIAINETKVVLQIPAEMEVTSLSRDGEPNEQDRTITWDLASMHPGDEVSLQFRARLTGNTNQRCQVLIESLETRSNRMDFETRAYIATELKLAMKNLTGPVNVGESAEFLVIASNTGRAAANGVVVEVEVPEWISPVPDSRYTIDQQNSRLVFEVVDVPEGMAAEFSFRGTCNSPGNFMVRSFLNHESQAQPMISDASLFVLDTQTEKVGGVISPEKTVK